MATVVTLESLKTDGTAAVRLSEEAMAETLDDISDGKKVTAEALLVMQIESTANSLTVMTTSTVVKERGDTLKGCCGKF